MDSYQLKKQITDYVAANQDDELIKNTRDNKLLVKRNNIHEYN
ncbi:MAG: hypothetical protein Q4G58_15950 [bacterium]|nr:hypothetical protein [bacterium]